MRGATRTPWLIVIALLALLPGARVDALDPSLAVTQYRFARWGVADGLPHASINAVFQDRDGFLWVGTYRGAARFDGRRFLPLADLVSETIESDHLQSIGQSSDGVLWFGGTYRPFLALAPDGRVRRYDQSHGLPGLHVTNIHMDTAGVRWIGTEHGLARMQGTWDQARFVPELDQVVWQMQDLPDGRLLAATENGPWLHADDRWQPLPGAGALARMHAWTLADDGRGGAWIGMRGRLSHWDGQQIQDLGPEQGLPSIVVRGLVRDRHDSLWIGSSGRGLARFRDGHFESLDTRTGLAGNVVWELLADREGDLWVGSASGLGRIRDAVVKSYGPPEGLRSGMVQATAPALAGGHWIGLNGEGLAHLSETGAISHPGVPGQGPGDGIVVSVLDRADGVLVGTYGGLFRWREGNFERVTAVQPQRVRSLLQLADGGVLVALDRGIGLLQGDQFQELDGLGALADAQVSRMHDDGPGAVLIAAGKDGAFRWEDGKVTPIAAAAGLSVRDIWRDPKGRLWVAAIGLHWLDEHLAHAVRPINERLPTQFHGLAADARGRLWASTNLGVLRVAVAELTDYVDDAATELTFETFGEAEGMRASECNGGHQNPLHLGADGSLWVATVDGVVAIGADAGPIQIAPPQARIERVVEDGHILWAKDGMRFLPGLRRLEIEFTAVELGAPERLSFRYRLQPFDKTWLDLTQGRSVSFNALAPGRYRFEVAAGIDDRHGPVAVLNFEIEPHWWQRRDLRIAALLGLIALLTAGYVLRVRALQRRQAALATEVAVRTHELAAANIMLADAARRDFLTGLGNRRDFTERLDSAWESGQPLALAIIDVDHFKAFNDRLGHLAGDRCLAQIGGLLQQLDPSVGAERIGGEEFSLLFMGATAERAHALCLEFRQRLHAAAIAHPANSASDRVSVSIGLATRAPADQRPEDLHMRADDALYAAKHRGRDCVVEWTTLLTVPVVVAEVSERS